jgi:hypothetical protein
MHDVAIIDLGGHTLNVEWLKMRFPHAHVTRYLYSHEQTIARCLTRARTSHMWIVSSCCDYSNFDFDWDPVTWEADQIHCWASGKQKYGDTFLIPVAEWKRQQPEYLHWFHDVNYHDSGVDRLLWPATNYGTADLTQSILATDFSSEYHLFYSDLKASTHIDTQPSLWGDNPHQLISFSTGNSMNLVPRRAKERLKTQVYDYVHLVRTRAVQDHPQDIIFISYDEPQADENWARLIDRFPSAKRVHGVDGMEHALKAAARLSSTPWFYATFAKTRLHEDWDFSFVPDRWQAPKHYIFNALNASNDLCYGHMGIILYHKQMVLDAPAWEQIGGMDFTMSFATESIPIVSVYGEFAISPYHAWRTAFREVSKLCQWQLEESSVETDYRIHVWKTHAHGDHAQWVLLGAKDGAEFFSKHADTEELKKAFRWDWLKDYFRSKYGPDLLP